MTGHTDGKISLWNVKNQDTPQTKFNPHQDRIKKKNDFHVRNQIIFLIHHQGANQGATSEADLVRSGAKFTPIEKIAWCATKSSSDPFIIFSGGTNVDNDTKVCRKCC